MEFLSEISEDEHTTFNVVCREELKISQVSGFSSAQPIPGEAVGKSELVQLKTTELNLTA